MEWMTNMWYGVGIALPRRLEKQKAEKKQRAVIRDKSCKLASCSLAQFSRSWLIYKMGANWKAVNYFSVGCRSSGYLGGYEVCIAYICHNQTNTLAGRHTFCHRECKRDCFEQSESKVDKCKHYILFKMNWYNVQSTKCYISCYKYTIPSAKHISTINNNNPIKRICQPKHFTKIYYRFRKYKTLNWHWHVCWIYDRYLNVESNC